MTHKQLQYNQRVMAWLRKHMPYHADELNSRGTHRGWWDQIRYFHITGKTVEQCGRSIGEIHLYDGVK